MSFWSPVFRSYDTCRVLSLPPDGRVAGVQKPRHKFAFLYFWFPWSWSRWLIWTGCWLQSWFSANIPKCNGKIPFAFCGGNQVHANKDKPSLQHSIAELTINNSSWGKVLVFFSLNVTLIIVSIQTLGHANFALTNSTQHIRGQAAQASWSRVWPNTEHRTLD